MILQKYIPILVVIFVCATAFKSMLYTSYQVNYDFMGLIRHLDTWTLDDFGRLDVTYRCEIQIFSFFPGTFTLQRLVSLWVQLGEDDAAICSHHIACPPTKRLETVEMRWISCSICWKHCFCRLVMSY